MFNVRPDLVNLVKSKIYIPNIYILIQTYIFYCDRRYKTTKLKRCLNVVYSIS